MKKFTLIFAVMLMTSFAFAQKGFVPRIYELGRAKVVKQAKTNVHKTTRAPGDVIWSEDFDSVRWAATSNAGVPVPTNAPAGYTLTDLTGNGFFWRWSTQGPRGRYTSPDHTICDAASALKSTTQSNGFLMFEADYYNVDDACNMIESPISHDSYVQYDGLDFSSSDNVVLRFEQKSRFCCSYGSESNSWFETSIDGTTWIKHDVSPTDINVGADNPTVTYLNLTTELANEASVSIRFHLQGLSHYHWEIDDVSFITPWQYDAWLQDYWNDYGTVVERIISEDDGSLNASEQFYGGFYLNPWFLTDNFVGYEAAYENFGSEDLTNFVHHVDIYRGEELYAQLKSVTKTLTYTQIDSILVPKAEFANIINIDSNFCVEDTAWRTEFFGKYETVHYCTFDEANQDASNDTMRRTFIITDTMLAYCDTANATLSSCAPDNWTGYVGDGDGVGMSASLPDPTEHDGGVAGQYYTLKSVNVYIPKERDEADALIAAGEAKLIAGVYKTNAEGALETTPFLTSAPFTLSLDDTTTWVNIPFAIDGFSEIITEGGYYAVVLQFYGSYVSDRKHTFSIGDDEIRKSAGGRALRIFNAGSFGWSYGAPAIILNIGYSLQNPTPHPVAINNTPEQLEFSIFPNPSNGNFRTNIKGNAQVTVVNAIGSTVDSFTTNNGTINLTNLEAGVYFVRIKSGNKVGTHQVVIN